MDGPSISRRLREGDGGAGDGIPVGEGDGFGFLVPGGRAPVAGRRRRSTAASSAPTKGVTGSPQPTSPRRAPRDRCQRLEALRVSSTRPFRSSSGRARCRRRTRSGPTTALRAASRPAMAAASLPSTDTGFAAASCWDLWVRVTCPRWGRSRPDASGACSAGRSCWSYPRGCCGGACTWRRQSPWRWGAGRRACRRPPSVVRSAPSRRRGRRRRPGGRRCDGGHGRRRGSGRGPRRWPGRGRGAQRRSRRWRSWPASPRCRGGRVTDDAVAGAAHFRGCPPRPGGDPGSSHHP